MFLSLDRLARHIPPEQLGRYLVVGTWNTAFAYGTFALLTWVLDRYVPASYLAASLLSGVLNITISFLGYKWFVFRTKGHYLKEWSRCVVVYGGGMVLSLAALPPTVLLVGFLTAKPSAAPYIAGALLLGIQVVLSFFGHKRFTFGGARVLPRVASSGERDPPESSIESGSSDREPPQPIRRPQREAPHLP